MTTRAWAGSATRIHPVGLGCMNLAGAYGPTDENEARSLLARVALGAFIPADLYGPVARIVAALGARLSEGEPR